MGDDTRLAEFLYEAGLLSRTPRTGFAFLGTGEQSVAAHSHRTMIVAFTLARMDGNVDSDRVLRMCLVHDLPEVRTSDHNYLTRQYNITDENRAIADLTDNLPFGDELRDMIEEFEAGETREAQLAKDADHIELILSLKELLDMGNQRAQQWIDDAVPRLQTETAKRLAAAIAASDSQQWYMRKTRPG